MSGSSESTDRSVTRFREFATPGVTLDKRVQNKPEGPGRLYEWLTDDRSESATTVPLAVTKAQIKEVMGGAERKKGLSRTRRFGLSPQVPWALGTNAAYNEYYSFTELVRCTWSKLVRRMDKRWNGDEGPCVHHYVSGFCDYQVGDGAPQGLGSKREDPDDVVDHAWGNHIHGVLNRLFNCNTVLYNLWFDLARSVNVLNFRLIGDAIQLRESVTRHHFDAALEDCLTDIMSRSYAEFREHDADPSETFVETREILRHDPLEFSLIPTTSSDDVDSICGKCQVVSEDVQLPRATQCVHYEVVPDGEHPDVDFGN
jgi:hypothetical protein